MSVVVRFPDREGVEQRLDAQPLVPGSHTPPPFLDVEPGTVRVRAGTGKDAVCGDLRLPALIQGRLEPRVITVPPPSQFTVPDVRAMWVAASQLDSVILFDAPLGGPGRQGGEAAPRIDWAHAAAAARLAELLIQRWPKTRTFEFPIADVERPLGVEAQPLTDQFLEQGRVDAYTRSGRTIAGQAAYRRMVLQPWTSSTLTVDLSRLVRALRTEAPSARRAVRTLSEAAYRAQPQFLRRDPPQSSWPPLASLLSASCRRALARPRVAAGEGRLGLPIQKVWDLYEKWLGIALLDALVGALGPSGSRSGRVLGRWRAGSHSLELRRKERFYWPRPSLLAGRSWVSVADSLLEPDYTIAIADGRRARLYLADAKAVSSLVAGDLPEMTAKYLDGIREARLIRGGEAHDVGAPGVAEIAVVAPVSCRSQSSVDSSTRVHHQPPRRLRRTRAIEARPLITVELAGWVWGLLVRSGWPLPR